MRGLVLRFRSKMCGLRGERRVGWRLPLVIRLLTDGHKASSFPVMSGDPDVDGCSGGCIVFRDESCFCEGGDCVWVGFTVGDGEDTVWGCTVEFWKRVMTCGAIGAGFKTELVLCTHGV
jgi:hypothetical protein